QYSASGKLASGARVAGIGLSQSLLRQLEEYRQTGFIRVMPYGPGIDSWGRISCDVSFQSWPARPWRWDWRPVPAVLAETRILQPGWRTSGQPMAVTTTSNDTVRTTRSMPRTCS